MTKNRKKNFMSGKYWLIVLIIVIASYNIYSGVKEGREWTQESRDILIKSCLRDAKNMAEKYPGLTKEYCKCSIDNIQTEFTQDEYIRVSKESSEVQKEKLFPSFEKCLVKYQEEIKNLN